MPSCPGSGRAGARARSVPCDGAVSSCCSEITRLSIWGSSRLNLSRENKWKKVVSSKFIVSYAVHTYFEGRVIKKKGAKRRKSDLWAFKKKHRYFLWLSISATFFPRRVAYGRVAVQVLPLGQYGLLVLFFCHLLCFGPFLPPRYSSLLFCPIVSTYFSFCLSYVEGKCLNWIEWDKWLVWRMKEMTLQRGMEQCLWLLVRNKWGDFESL